MPKYISSKTAVNDNELYDEMFEERGIKNGIVQQRTVVIGNKFKNVSTPTRKHVWSMGDRFFKLSYQYYDTYNLWWVIALFNGVPTEAHLNYGDVIYIPLKPNALISEI